MTENKGLNFLDYLIIIARWKKFLLITFLSLAVISYFFIYFLVKEEFDATALIVPNEQNDTGAFSSLLKDFSSLPLNIEGLNVRNDNDFYTAIIFSRTNLEKIIRKFDLLKEYKAENMEDAIKVLSSKINTSETDEDAYQITVRSGTPQKAALVTNYIIEELNKTVIDLNIKKTKDNRAFLEKRYNDIKRSLKDSEDSLQIYQQKTGIYEAEGQSKSIIETFSKLESELASKKVELSIYEKIYGHNSPLTNNARIAEEELAARINSMKKGEKNSMLSGLNTLPEKAMNYFRYYRDVQIYNTMLEYIIPLYEQSRFDEQKTIPVLQVIDYAVPPLKRAAPKRTVTALVISAVLIFFILFFIIIREILKNSQNPKLLLLKNELSLSKKVN